MSAPLHTPGLDQDLPELLRRCVECGLCLPHCATYVGTGNEVQSPRGRLALLGQLLEQDPHARPDDYLAAFDVCIGCRACETACPSGVPFTLLEKGKEMASASPAVTSNGPDIPGGSIILRQLDSPGFLAATSRLAGGARKILSTVLGSGWRGRLEGGPLGSLARLISSMPRGLAGDEHLTGFLDDLCGPAGLTAPTETAPESATMTTPAVAFFAGCANKGLLPGSSRRLLELLRASGCLVTVPAGQECCGALASHTDRPGREATLRRRNLRAFAPHLNPDTRILVEAAGCGMEMKEKYGADFADRTTDAAVLLDELALPPLGTVPLKVTYHDPCHARHGQGIVDEPRRLLRRVPGLQLVEPAEADVCCGSGGAWGLNHPELSSELGRRKARNLAATGADIIVTSNPGCLGQIADGLALEAPHLAIIPLTDLLWYAWQRGLEPSAG